MLPPAGVLVIMWLLLIPFGWAAKGEDVPTPANMSDKTPVPWEITMSVIISESLIFTLLLHVVVNLLI